MWVPVISGAVLLLSVSFQMLVMLWVWLVSHHVQRGPLLSGQPPVHRSLALAGADPTRARWC